LVCGLKTEEIDQMCMEYSKGIMREEKIEITFEDFVNIFRK
jgi:hypothetical protein